MSLKLVSFTEVKVYHLNALLRFRTNYCPQIPLLSKNVGHSIYVSL